jgi:hypothetical protein
MYVHDKFSTNAEKSVVSLFNQLVAGYLHTCYDSQSEKVYVNTINNFANGAFSDAVMKDGNWIDDSARDGAGNVPGGVKVTDIKHVLTRSLALVMRGMLTAKYPGKTFKHFLETDLAEIPLFIKENYRMNMPVYTKMLALLIKRCEMLKNFSSASSDANLVYNANLLNQVIIGSQSLMGCMRDVLEELADAPLYLETHKDSIKEYEALNGQKPMMPMSSLLYYLQDGQKALPDMGREENKMLYGTRGVFSLSGEYGLSKLPGMRDILQKHNETSESEYHLDEKSLGNHVSDSLLALRHLVNAKHYLSFMMLKVDKSHLVGPLKLVSDAANTVAIVSETAAYSIGKGNRELVKILQLTESSKQRESRRVIVETVERTDKTIIRGSREQIRMMNIIDMNIVPINVHALMREMPLVNLFNYSYTFDAMVCNMMGVDSKHMNSTYNVDGTEDVAITFTDMLAKSPVRERARKVMGYMLLHPYAAMDEQQFHDNFGRIVRGATGIAGLGRPKFLGDELYNKALFGEVYTAEKYWDDSGHVADSSNRAPSANQFGYAALQALMSSGGFTNNDKIKGEMKTLVEEYVKAAQSSATLDHAAFRLLVDAVNNAKLTTNGDLDTALTAVRDELGNVYRSDHVHSSDEYLRYLHPTKDGRGDIVKVKVGKDNRQKLQTIGYNRFNTVYCRSLVWLTNIQRVLRLKLREDLEWYDSRIVKDNAVTSADITEQYGNEAHSYTPRHYSN